MTKAASSISGLFIVVYLLFVIPQAIATLLINIHSKKLSDPLVKSCLPEISLISCFIVVPSLTIAVN